MFLFCIPSRGRNSIPIKKEQHQMCGCKFTCGYMSARVRACVRLQTWQDIYSGDIHRFWMQIKLQQSFAGRLLLGNLCLLCNLVCRCFTSYVLAQYIYWTLWEHVAQLGFIYTLTNKASGSGCDVTGKQGRGSRCYLFSPPNTQEVDSHKFLTISSTASVIQRQLIIFMLQTPADSSYDHMVKQRRLNSLIIHAFLTRPSSVRRWYYRRQLLLQTGHIYVFL